MLIFFSVVTILTTLLSILFFLDLCSEFSVYRRRREGLESYAGLQREHYQRRLEESREETLYSAKLYLLVLFWPVGLLYAVYHLFKKNGPVEKFFEDAKSLFTK